jgi:hypothetical protein
MPPYNKLPDRAAGEQNLPEGNSENSSQRFIEYLNVPVSAEFLAQRQKYIKNVEAGRRQSLKDGEVADISLGKALKAPEDIFTELGKGGIEQQKAMRDFSIGSIKYIGNFSPLYVQWKESFKLKKDPVLMGVPMTLEEYVRMKAKENITEERRQLIRQRTDAFYDSFYEEHPPAEKLPDEKTKSDKERFFGDVDLYVQENAEELASLNSFPEEKRNARRHILLSQFQLVLKQNGFKDVEKEKADRLFDEIVGDMESEDFEKKAYDIYAKKEMEAADANLTEDEWEKIRQQELGEAANAVKEKPAENTAPAVYSGGAGEAIAAPSYGKIDDVALASHVHFTPVDPIGKPDLFTVQFTSIQENIIPRSFTPFLKVVYDPKFPGDINRAKFTLQEPWADKESPKKGSPFGESTSLVFKPSEMVNGINTLILDYLMNKKLWLKVPEVAKEGPNDIINDTVMMRFANRILAPDGVKKPLDDVKIKMFERMMLVVLKDNPPNYGSLLKRVDKMSRLLERDELLGRLQNIFKEDSGSVWDMNSLVDALEGKSSGKKS